MLDEYLHVHRQQVTIKSEKGLDYVEVLYTRLDKCMREDVAQLVLGYGRRNCVCLL